MPDWRWPMPARGPTQVTAAGAVFVGHEACEALGDYFAGPSHVLPTGGSARFSSPLGVGDFLKRTSFIEYDLAAVRRQADAVAVSPKWKVCRATPARFWCGPSPEL
jgi:histidinol dehydrogenase